MHQMEVDFTHGNDCGDSRYITSYLRSVYIPSHPFSLKEFAGDLNAIFNSDPKRFPRMILFLPCSATFFHLFDHQYIYLIADKQSGKNALIVFNVVCRELSVHVCIGSFRKN